MLPLVLLSRAFAHDPRLAGYSRATVGAFLVLLVRYVVTDEQPGVGIVQRLSALVVFAWLPLVAYGVDGLGPDPLSSTGRRRRP